MKPWFGLGKLELAAFVFFSLFLLLQCLSIAAANVALGFSVFFILCLLISAFKNSKKKGFLEIYQQNRFLCLLFVLFWGTILCSAIFSGDLLKGSKIFIGQFIYRAVPLFIILFIFPKKGFASFFLFLSLLSCILDVIGGIIIHGDGPRLRGLYGHPMTLAGFLITSLPILFCFLLDWKQNRKALFLTIASFLIGFTGLLLNGTRGAWLALAVTLPLVTILYDRSIKKILFLVVFAIGTSLVFFNSPQLQNRAESITSTTLQSNTERLLMWESACEMFKDHPVFGVGIGQYSSKYLTEYKSPEAREKQNHCHNNFLQMLAENGVVGFIGFCLLFGYILLSSLKKALFNSSPYHVLIFGSTLALLLQGFTEYNFGNSAVIKYYWAILGCLLVLAHQSENKTSGSSFPPFQCNKTEI